LKYPADFGRKNLKKEVTSVMAKTKIIVALDGLEIGRAMVLAESLASLGVLFKANDLLDTNIGLQVIKGLKDLGVGVMADPKVHDIPNTAKNRIKKFAAFGPDLITVHASGGVEMMRYAVEGAGSVSKILAVTVLTSLGEEECNINLGGPVKVKVLQYARNAVLAGAYGIVSSGEELAFLSKYPETRILKKVVPGIRPTWEITEKDDQKRVVTPANAVKGGADYLVIGRPIYEAADPAEAVRRIQKEIEEAEAEMAAAT
jgi:orotidine-5'-phosphate decarboxylase